MGEIIQILFFTRIKLTISALVGVRGYLLDLSGDECVESQYCHFALKPLVHIFTAKVLLFRAPLPMFFNNLLRLFTVFY